MAQHDDKAVAAQYRAAKGAQERERIERDVALRELMARHPRERFLANLNPGNAASAALFRKLGFRLIQHTYEVQYVAQLGDEKRPICYC